MEARVIPTNYTCLACVGLLQYTQAVLCLVGEGACQLVKTTTKSEKLNTHRLYSSINENIEVDFTTRK